MRFSNEDVAQQKFEIKLRGYHRGQVREFLTVISAHLSDYVSENKRLNVENEDLSKQLREYRRRERSLQDALEMARTSAIETRSKAQRDADVLVAEAELIAEHKIVGAERAVSAAREALAALKEQRMRVIAEMRSTLEMHLHLIDSQKQPSDTADAEPRDTLPAL